MRLRMLNEKRCSLQWTSIFSIAKPLKASLTRFLVRIISSPGFVVAFLSRLSRNIMRWILPLTVLYAALFCLESFNAIREILIDKHVLHRSRPCVAAFFFFFVLLMCEVRVLVQIACELIES